MDLLPGPKKRPIPPKAELEKVYPKKNLKEAGAHFGVGQTLFLKWLEHYGIPRKKFMRAERSEEHKRRLSEANIGRVGQRSGVDKRCPICGQIFYVNPARLRQAETHYCSYECLGAAKQKVFGSKVCPECKEEFSRKLGETSGNYDRKVYCSIACSTKAHPPPVLVGKENPRYKGTRARKNQPRGTHGAWAKKVLSRDSATCQRCGVQDVPLVAHHILSWEDFPELRADVDNGVTLCNPCHFIEHGWNLSANGIKTLIDERGIETRRWTGHCLWCNTFIVKPASDMRRSDGSYRTYGFCSNKCKLQGIGYAKRGVSRGDLKNSRKVQKFLEDWERRNQEERVNCAQSEEKGEK